MDAINEVLSRAVGELLGRSSGPFHARLVIQPIVASLLAIRAGMRDARAGRPPFLWTILRNPQARKYLIESGWKDIGKIFTVAIVLDTVYQLIVLRGFYVVQALIVAIVVALLPYVLLRGPVSRIARSSLQNQ
jgi:hypothetical protein